MEATSSAWTRHRAALRAEIVHVARGLFVERGFDAVTVDDIASTVGISRRSFFRYFGTKEDVLLSDLSERGNAIAEALRARPAGEDAWIALLMAMSSVRAAETVDHEADLAIGRMMLQTPSLRARHLEKRLRWQGALVPLVEQRIAGEARRLRATAIVVTVLSCLDAATETFVLTEGATGLEQAFRTALEAAALSAPRTLLQNVPAG